MNGMNTAGTSANGSHDRPPPAVITGIPGAVETNSGGPASGGRATTVGAAFGASCGTGTIDCSVGVPWARGASGRTGRHITTVVVCAATFAAGFRATRRALRTIGRGVPVATFFDLGFATTALRGAVVLRRTGAGAFLAGATTGVHSMSESTDVLRTTFWVVRGVVSRRTTCCPFAELADSVTTSNVESVAAMKRRGGIVPRFVVQGAPRQKTAKQM